LSGGGSGIIKENKLTIFCIYTLDHVYDIELVRAPVLVISTQVFDCPDHEIFGNKATTKSLILLVTHFI
jgi:hypothetical protein